MRERMNLTVGQRILAGPPLVIRSTSCWPFFFAFFASLMSAIPAFRRANASAHQRHVTRARRLQQASTQLVFILLVHTQIERVVPHVVVNSSLLGVPDHGVGLSTKEREVYIIATEEVVFAGVAEIK